MPNPSPSPAKPRNNKTEPARSVAPEKREAPRNGAAAPPVVGRPTDEQIAARAYEIYEREGRQPGRELENWLRAEAELTAGTH
jgi:hypothetical protein